MEVIISITFVVVISVFGLYSLGSAIVSKDILHIVMFATVDVLFLASTIKILMGTPAWDGVYLKILFVGYIISFLAGGIITEIQISKEKRSKQRK